MKNSIYLRRKNKVILKAGNDKAHPQHIASILKNFEYLGYTFSKELIERISTFSLDSLMGFYNDILKDVRQMVGGHKKYSPMYPNFPEQVMEASEAELYINAMLHYIGRVFGARIMPDYEKEERSPLISNFDLKVIDLGDETDFVTTMTNLISANTSISDTDKEDLNWFIKAYGSTSDNWMLDIIPNKENLAFVSAIFLTDQLRPKFPVHLFKTATDILRLATSISEGDISLATNTKFKNFPRSIRKLLLSMVENAQQPTEDMRRHKGKWIRLGERLHPGEYKNKFPQTFRAFDVVRNNLHLETFNGAIEAALMAGNVQRSVDLLKMRPGDMARRMDHLLRLDEKSNKMVISEFAKVVNKISTPVLLQVMAHFKHRNEDNPTRAIFPKGNIAKLIVLPNELPRINGAEEIRQICRDSLVKRFGEKSSLGKVYVDKNLRNYLVPFSQRSASKALRTLVRGSKLKMSEGDIIRFFLWWKDMDASYENEDSYHGRTVDVDLSATLYDTNWQYMQDISYTNLRSEKFSSAHSGDITSAPNGACEFIDIDIESFTKYKGRYVVMNVLSYSEQKFNEMPECFAGWMMRSESQSGEIFEPKTVQDKLDITSETTVCIPIILDLVRREITWADLGLNGRSRYGGNNVHSNGRTIAQMGNAVTSLKKANLYDLFKMHAVARGSEIVDDKIDAETIFSETDGVTPFEIEDIMANYM